jgi:DNA repair protein RecO (recombination protein O)
VTKTLAFVLKTQDYRDTSLLAYFYTRDFGKIHGIVKGIRDTRARFGSTLEPFSLNEILFYKRRRGGDLHQVTQIDLVDSFVPVREDLERLAYASYFADLLNEWLEIEEPNPAIFDLMRESLSFLASGASPKRAARIFEIKLCEQLGLMPQIGECAVCGVKTPEPAYFNTALGGIHCRDCGPSARVSSLPVSRGALNFLEHVRRSEVSELSRVKVSQEVGEDLEKVLRRFVDYHLTHPLKTVSFLEQMGM